VRTGDTPGIYLDCREAQRATSGVAGSAWCKVRTQAEAQTYLEAQQLSGAACLEAADARQAGSPSVSIYTDGSHTASPRAAGWGFVAIYYQGDPAANPPETPAREHYGPVCLDPDHPDFLGATHLSNSTAELSAIGQALRWALQTPFPRGTAEVQIRTDSQASMDTMGAGAASKNGALVDTVKASLAALRHTLVDAREPNQRLSVTFVWIRAHQEDRTVPSAYWNARADHLAGLGRALPGLPARHSRAPPLTFLSPLPQVELPGPARRKGARKAEEGRRQLGTLREGTPGDTGRHKGAAGETDSARTDPPTGRPAATEASPTVTLEVAGRRHMGHHCGGTAGDPSGATMHRRRGTPVQHSTGRTPPQLDLRGST